MNNKKELYKKDPHRCPHCHVVIRNFEELSIKTEYSCGACLKNFFIERTPNFYYNSSQ
jgi:DNA-directed RNA polymerase subunit RPC12/RpoP